MNVSVQLTRDIKDRLEALVAKTGRSQDAELRAIIEMGLEDAEDYQAAVEAMGRLERGEEKVLSSEDFWRGLDD